ncbi:MAG: hypothetical protein FJ144_16145 [Deltaproteobacteria bacterium]|nr:hypothetical protein [Deltaproteobacteria bacterium]
MKDRTAVFGDAHRAMRDGRSADARRGFEASVDQVPELADHALYHAARPARSAGDRDAARGHLARLLNEHRDSVWVGVAATERGEIELEDGTPALALGSFDLALGHWEAIGLERAKHGKARALEAQGRLGAAYALAWELSGSGAPIAPEAAVLRERLEDRGAAALGMTPRELVARRAEALLRDGQAEAALAALEAGPRAEAKASGDADLLRARILVAAGRRDEAREVYGRAASSSDAAVSGTALYERAREAWNRDLDDAAAVDFTTLLERHPEHEKAPEALYALGRITEKRGDLGGAARRYENLVLRHPSARPSEEAAWRAGFVRYLAGDRRDAAATWQKLAGRDDALYWHGRALTSAGDPEAGQAILEQLGARSPWSYYAWWTEKPESAAKREPPPQASPESLSSLARAHLESARLLHGLGLDSDAALELGAAEHAGGPSPLFLTEYESVDAYPRSIRLALALRGRGVTGLDPHLYPRAHWSRLETAARQHGLDPLLLASLARQESLFDARARSPAGAHGVMQLLPKTASALTGRPVAPAELESPEQNIELGARYLRQMLDRFDGRIILAIAAYNAGPEAVDRWIALSGGRPGDEFVELISYRETRDYVKAVLRNYRVYRALYGRGPPPRLY